MRDVTTWDAPAYAVPYEPPAWTQLTVEQAADARVVAAVAVAAVAGDAAVRAGIAGVGGVLAAVVAAGGLMATGRTRSAQAHAVLAGVPVLAVFLVLRRSPALLAANVATIAALLVVGASFARSGDLLRLTFRGAVVRAASAIGHGSAAPAFVMAPLRRSEERGRRPTWLGAVVRGALLALPVVLIVVPLLASADVLFASWVRIPSLASVVGHAILLIVFGWAMAGLTRVASSRGPEPAATPLVRIGAIEAIVVVATLVAVYGAFAVAQVVAASEGGRHVLTTAGLTYAEYARSGFFQLLAAAAITLVVLLGLRRAADDSGGRLRTAFVISAELAVVLTLVLVAVAVRRLLLYESAFGLTLLRLYAIAFAVWIGGAFLLLAAALVAPRTVPLLTPAGALGLAVLLTLNVINPEAVVVRHNLDHFERTGKFDALYSSDLSEDAVPALVDALPRLPRDERETVRDSVCADAPGSAHRRGWLAYNAAVAAAERAQARACRVTVQ